MRIAILEDDPSQLELLSNWVTAAGHHPVPFERAEAFLNAMPQQQFEMLIFDWNLPDAAGIEILKQVRQTSKVPVLFCTARAAQDDVLKGLREGADDYLIKPLRRLELLARIEAVARRARKKQATNGAFEASEFRVDCESRTITRDGAVIELTAKDFDLAVLFFRNVGRLLSRAHIHQAVWGATGAITSRTLDTHVSRIRNKVGLLPAHGWHLQSVYAHGYRLEQVARDASVETQREVGVTPQRSAVSLNLPSSTWSDQGG
jgi:DNA-binding response OmpR family regulator